LTKQDLLIRFDVKNGHTKPDPEYMGMAVGISLISHSIPEIFLKDFRFTARHLELNSADV